MVRHGIQILQVEDRTILVNNTPYEIHLRPLLANHTLGRDDQVTSALLTAPLQSVVWKQFEGDDAVIKPGWVLKEGERKPEMSFD